MRTPSAQLLVFGLALLGTTAWAAPITFNTALPVSRGEFILRGQAKLIRSSDDPSSLNRDLTVWAAPAVLAYGITDRLTLFGVVPYLNKSMTVNTPLGRRQRGDAGLGDSTLLARQTILEWNSPGQTLRLAPFAGLQAPTGADDHLDSLGALPRPLQLGSGSWAPLFGAVFTWQRLAGEFDTAASYKVNTEADGYQFGDQAEWDLSYQRRVWPRKLAGGVPGFLYAVLESNVEGAGRDRAGGHGVADTGGTTWFLAPGVQFVTRRLVLEAAVEVPVVQALNGSALKNDFILTGGFRVNF